MKLSRTKSLESKKRYLYFEIISELDINLKDVVNAIWISCFDLLGEIRTANANIWIIKNLWSNDKHTGVLRCSHTSVDDIRSALCTITEIEKHRTIFHVIRVSGTINCLKI